MAPRPRLLRIHRVLLYLLLACVARAAGAQGASPAEYPIAVGGAVTLTTKGISTIPSFTLGKPAAIFDVSIAKHGLSFEPQFKFGPQAKPWSFVFWGRYRLVETEKVHVLIGAHPAIAFKSTPVSTAAGTSEVMVARRYYAGELSPSYSLTRSVRVGAYYLYSQAAESDVAKHTHFLSARAAIANLGLPDPYVLRFAPQLYYLRVDRNDGVYVNAGATLARRTSPFAISSTINRSLHTTVPGSDPLLWNVSLSYAID